MGGGEKRKSRGGTEVTPKSRKRKTAAAAIPTRKKGSPPDSDIDEPQFEDIIKVQLDSESKRKEGGGDHRKKTRLGRRLVNAGTEESAPQIIGFIVDPNPVKVEPEVDPENENHQPELNDDFIDQDLADSDIDVGEVKYVPHPALPEDKFAHEDEEVDGLDSNRILGEVETPSADSNRGNVAHSTSEPSDSDARVGQTECGNDTGREKNNNSNISTDTNEQHEGTIRLEDGHVGDGTIGSQHIAGGTTATKPDTLSMASDIEGHVGGLDELQLYYMSTSDDDDEGGDDRPTSPSPPSPAQGAPPLPARGNAPPRSGQTPPASPFLRSPRTRTPLPRPAPTPAQISKSKREDLLTLQGVQTMVGMLIDDVWSSSPQSTIHAGTPRWSIETLLRSSYAALGNRLTSQPAVDRAVKDCVKLQGVFPNLDTYRSFNDLMRAAEPVEVPREQYHYCFVCESGGRKFKDQGGNARHFREGCDHKLQTIKYRCCARNASGGQCAVERTTLGEIRHHVCKVHGWTADKAKGGVYPEVKKNVRNFKEQLDEEDEVDHTFDRPERFRPLIFPSRGKGGRGRKGGRRGGGGGAGQQLTA